MIMSEAVPAGRRKLRRWLAIALPDTAVEARIRLALLLYRAGRHDAALEHLTQAGVQSIQDPALRYLRFMSVIRCSCRP